MRHKAHERGGSAMRKLAGLTVLGAAGAAAVMVFYDPARTWMIQKLRAGRDLVEQQAKRLLSLALGANVQFEHTRLSLLNGFFEAQAVTITAHGSREPLMRVDHLRVLLSPRSILTGELSLQRLALRHPVISILRRADGSTNLPGWLLPEAREIPEKAHRLIQAGELAEKSPLGLEIVQADLHDAEIHFRDDSAEGYHVSATGIEGFLRHTHDGYEITGSANSIGRRDQPTELGAMDLQMKLIGSEDLSDAAAARIEACMDLPQKMRAELHSPSLKSRRFEMSMAGQAELGSLVPMIPPSLSSTLAPLAMGQTEGKVSLSMRITYSPEEGLKVQDMHTEAHNVTVLSGEDQQNAGQQRR